MVECCGVAPEALSLILSFYADSNSFCILKAETKAFEWPPGSPVCEHNFLCATYSIVACAESAYWSFSVLYSEDVTWTENY